MEYDNPTYKALPMEIVFGLSRPHHLGNRFGSTPIDLIPPCLQIHPLACEAISGHIVLQPHMLPCIYAEQGRDIDAAERHLGLPLLCDRRRAEQACRVGRLGLCVLVDGLAAVVSAGQGASGEVGGQDAVFSCRVCLYQPHETGTEHGFGRGEELFAQRLHGREGLD